MEVSRVRALRGPNLWSHHTSVEAIVSCTPDEESVATLPEFEARLRARFPQIGQLQPMGHDDTVAMAQVLELAALNRAKPATAAQPEALLAAAAAGWALGVQTDLVCAGLRTFDAAQDVASA